MSLALPAFMMKQHDAGRGPVVEVVQAEGMPDLVQQDMDVVGVEVAHMYSLPMR